LISINRTERQAESVIAAQPMSRQADFSAGLALALDVGTSSLKGVLYALADGHLIAESSASYSLQRPYPMWVEQQPSDWWAAVETVCKALCDRVPALHIRVVGLTGQVPTMVLVDRDGHAVAPAISWQDRRAEDEAVWLRREVGAEQLSAWLGLDIPIDPGWPPARLLWLARHRPEWIAQSHKVLLAKDYIGCQLTGTFCSDAWSAKGIVHLTSGEPPAAYYQRIGFPAALAPQILPAHQIIGAVTRTAAALVGLQPGTPVVNGSSDAVCGMIGTGAVGRDRTAFNLTGTSEMIGRSGGQPTTGLLFIPASVTSAHPILYGPTQSGGDSLVWYAEFCRTDFTDAAAAALDAPPGARGIVFLPYLAGERAPIWDSQARGAFLGLLREHDFACGARAVMEGVAMSVRHVLEIAGVDRQSDIPLRIAGKSARLALWNQIRADVTGLCVEIVEQGTSVTLGAAMLAAVGIGHHRDLVEASALVRVETTLEPQPAFQPIYDDAYCMFRHAYPALRGMRTVQ
jgi:xylulokinase